MSRKPTQREIEAVKRSISNFAPPPDLTVSEWADSYRFLSSEASSEPGKYITDRAPYQREPQDACGDSAIETVILLFASQTGKTEILNNTCGYFIHQDPAPVMMVQPTKEMGEAWSKDRFTPMVRDTPKLNELLHIDSRRDGENTILHKKFPGGNLTISGANSPASLASRPKRVMLLDEVDRYPVSAKKEGRPSKLAIKRTTTFWNRKIIKTSSPTIRGESEIESDFENSDQRRYYIKCPHCHELQTMRHEQLQWPDAKPEQAIYVCEHNGCIMTDGDKAYMLKNGEWRAHKPFTGIAGFHLSSLYSPWVKFSQYAVKFVEAVKDPEKLKVFINTEMAETYEENLDGEGIEPDKISENVDDYTLAPEGVLVVTMAVDVQKDRLELEILGWGKDFESWSMQYEVIHGDPAQKEVWQDLDDYITTKIIHESGVKLPIACVCIDSGGHHTEQVYIFCKDKQKKGKRVYAIKGSSTSGKPVIATKSKNNSHNCILFTIGTDTAKDTIFAWLKVKEPGAGYCHFPASYPDEYFDGLVSEKLVKRYVKGRTTKLYVKKNANIRNEPLDLRVYNLAALKILKPNFEKVALRLKSKVEALKKSADESPLPKSEKASHAEPTPAKSKPKRRGKKNNGFVNRWR
jgi:phage terminase large subunit GpA-like protein